MQDYTQPFLLDLCIQGFRCISWKTLWYPDFVDCFYCYMNPTEEIQKSKVGTTEPMFVQDGHKITTISYLEKHVWCPCFYLGCQDFIPKLLCLDNLLGLPLKIQTEMLHMTGIKITGNRKEVFPKHGSFT